MIVFQLINILHVIDLKQRKHGIGATQCNLEEYKANLDLLLNKIGFPVKFYDCKQVHCSNQTHKLAIDNFCSELIESGIKSGERILPFHSSTTKTIPGWTDHLTAV